MVIQATEMTLQNMRFYPVLQGLMGYPVQAVTAFFDGNDFYAYGEKLQCGDSLLGIISTLEPVSPDADIPALDSLAYVGITEKTQLNGDGTTYPFMSHPDLSHPDVVYLYQALDILRKGVTTSNRTSTNSHKSNMYSVTFDVRLGAPTLTTKSVGSLNAFKELRWMLSGDSNNNTLRATGCTIWDEWATEDGDLGPVYGAMWAHWPDRRLIRRDTPDLANVLVKLQDRGFNIEQEGPNGVVVFREINQIDNVINKLRNRPNDRRILVTGLNPSFTPYDDLSPVENARDGQQALPPCHLLYHFMTEPLSRTARLKHYQAGLGEQALPVAQLVQLTDKQLDALRVPRYYLDLDMYQRSADFFLGCPYNRNACYQMMLFFAAKANMIPRYFKHDTGDTHFYVDHIEQITLQMTQPIGPRCHGEILNAEQDDITKIGFKMHGYVPGIKISGDVAV